MKGAMPSAPASERESEAAAGTGARFDPDSTTPVPAGGFAVHTPGKVHYDGAKDEEVIVQIMGMGPSATNVVNPAGN